MPPSDMADFYGWKEVNPILRGELATSHNDGYEGGSAGGNCPEKTHAEIADLFEQEVLLVEKTE